MTNIIYIIIFAVIPVSTFFGGFLGARQSRALENVPLFFRLFVQHRLLYSFVMGFFTSLILMATLGSVTGFSTGLFFGFIGIFLLATFCYYFGITFGWGNATATSESAPTTNPAQVETAFPENLIVENSLDSVKITINTKKEWGLLVMEVFQWIVMGLCLLPITSLAVISLSQNYLPESFRFLVWLLVAGLVLCLLYVKFMEALEYVFDKEMIKIDNLSVRIEKYGSRFSSKKEYTAENMKIMAMFSFSKTNTVIKRSRFANSSMPAFILWHNRGLKRYRKFGRGVDLADTQKILEMVYAKFPQYKG
ncbi:MAG: hypothetical protein WA821_15415 [Anaerolineales bacterium]